MNKDGSALFIMFSNIFLVIPAITAGIYHQWLYCFFATGLVIFSPLFHWYRIKNINSGKYKVFKTLDWLFAIGAFLYMYYYIFNKINTYQTLLFILLTLVVVFFWYGWKKASYEKFHPWFHIVASLVSTLILLIAN